MSDGETDPQKTGAVYSPIAAQKKRQAYKKLSELNERKMEAYIARRQAVTAKLGRIVALLEDEDHCTVHHLDTYLKRVDSCYDEFNLIQNEVYTLFPDQREEQEQFFIGFETVYEQLRVQICSKLEILRAGRDVPQMTLLAPAVAVDHQPGLPHVPLPVFDGTYEKWFRFKQLFQDLMGKYPLLSNATKLHYLTQSLKGKAENIFSDQVLNENNFDAAWNQLEQRFENKRTIIDIHVSGLLNLKKMTKESSAELRQLVEECSRHVEALEFQDQKMQGMSEQLVVSLLTSKLDKSTHSMWENSLQPKDLPNYKVTMDFLRNRCFVLERCEANSMAKPSDAKLKTLVPFAKPPFPNSKPPLKVHAAQQVADEVCVVCGEPHNINKCNVMKQKSLSERLTMVKDKQLCYNCLKQGHRVGQCRSRACTVSGCGKRHHTLLHAEAPVTEKSPTVDHASTQGQKKEEASATSGPSIVCSSSSSQQCNKEVILSTALVNVKDFRGQYHPCRVLLDSGSQSNFLSEHFAKQLQLKREAAKIPIVGISGDKQIVTQQTSASITSLHREGSWFLDFLVVPQVTGILPSRKIEVRDWNLPQHLPLADPRFHVPAKVDMLLGAELFFELLCTERFKLADNQPMLWQTKLGWIVCGSHDAVQRPAVVAATCLEADAKLDSLVQRFWEQEELSDSATLSTENQRCLDHFATTHRRENGRYVVRLPFRSTVKQLGNSRKLAERRFLQAERKLAQNPELSAQYTAFIDEYIRLGHCVSVNVKDDGGFYLPHHAIIKPSSSTTKLRVVFDASAQSDSGYSLNDVLVTGPVVQDNLMAIVLRFRKYKYVFTSDVTKMYRQVRVDDRDTIYQRILWRAKPQDELQTLELKTVTYGTSCAPFCATVCLKQLAQDEGAEFPLAAQVVQKGFYIDDVLAGSDDLQEALECQAQLVALLDRGGFALHKWCANDFRLLEKIPEKERELQASIEDYSLNDVVKTLGLLWDPSNDVFRFHVQADEDNLQQHTKRTVLSSTARIFDPLGMLGPVIISLKLFCQELWAKEVKWDDPLPAPMEKQWKQIRAELRHINEIGIPRRVVADKATRFEIHGFSDASKKAYAACVYLRSLKMDGTAEMKLLGSKTRVAPLPKKPESKKAGKPFTIPRAELCGALLLAKLVTTVLENMDMKVESVVLWCDAQIVLCWLKKSPSSMEVFVGNRVRQIQQLTENFQWRYINTKLNPADEASRGIKSLELAKSELWWYGPSMLQDASYTYEEVDEPLFTSEELELRPVHSNVAVKEVPWEMLTRFSNFKKLQRVFARAVRIARNWRIRDQSKRITGPLKISELRQATNWIIAETQREGFDDELRMLKKNDTKKSKLLPLAPFLDDAGLLRVGGRLKNANIAYGHKHQLLLPRHHHVTKILIESLHKDNLHIGQQALLAVVRQRYWPIRAKDTIRQVVHNCIRCFRMKPPVVEQYMGDLPYQRVNPSPAFYRTGVDYAGPFLIRQGIRGASKVKAYVALFICLSTKALHLELVSNLSTEAFLAALQRFVGRRGVPELLMSDNATNFKGACNELHQLYELFQSTEAASAIEQYCASKEIQWSFIPPRSPNFGGVWEAGVKAAKNRLKIVLYEASVNYEEMTTVLVQVEAILNSRPLTQASNDPHDLTALTPAHFLVGRELTAIPEPEYASYRVSSLTRWQHLQKLKQHFWARWSAEYLCELQPRGKWFKGKLVLKPGMLVVIREDNMPPQQWKLGRIVKLHPGTDNITRVVTIRTANGEFTRGVSKIAVLPLDNEDTPEAHIDSDCQRGENV